MMYMVGACCKASHAMHMSAPVYKLHALGDFPELYVESQ